MEWNTANTIFEKTKITSPKAIFLTTSADMYDYASAVVAIDINTNYGKKYSQVDVNGQWYNLNYADESNLPIQHEITDIRDIVKTVKIGLGLPDKDIADIFNISRQTLYNYRTQEPTINNLNSGTYDRAKKIHFLILDLNFIFHKSPGPAAKNILVDQNSLFNLLTQENLNTDLIKLTAQIIEKQIQNNRLFPHIKSDTESGKKRTLYNLTKHT